MALSTEDREHVLRTAVEILKHRRRDQLIQIVADRIEHDTYDDEHERELDRVIFALTQTIDEELSAPS